MSTERFQTTENVEMPPDNLESRRRSIGLKEYYRHYISICGVLATFVGYYPLLLKLLPDQLSDQFFPPLGQLTTPARLLTPLSALILTFVVFFVRDASFVSSKQKRRKIMLSGLGSVLLGLVSYLAVYQISVTSVSKEECPAIQGMFSTGFERTPYAKEHYTGQTDATMLCKEGTEEGDIRRLWTTMSIYIGRLSLLLSYILVFLGSVFTFSLGVLYDACGPAPND